MPASSRSATNRGRASGWKRRREGDGAGERVLPHGLRGRLAPQGAYVISAARVAALDALLRVERDGAYSSEVLHGPLTDGLSAQDRGLCMELVLGVLRWRSWLDGQIARQLSMPFQKTDEAVRAALRLGAYQLVFLSRVPAHAAIGESVELVKRARKRSAAPLVNAVLRKIAVAKPAPSAKPSTLEELAESTAHPGWLVERWGRHFGWEAAEAICGYDQRVPPTTVRVVDESAERALAAEGVELAPGRLLGRAREVVRGQVMQTAACAESLVRVQDEASQLVAELMGRGYDGAILDGCAAPGGKTAVIAENNAAARIVACELHPHRAALLGRRVAAPNVRVVQGDLRALPVEPCGRVLVDAPCSGTGTLARNPEIKWRLEPQAIDALQALQRELLRAALAHLAPGGRLVYATCSLEPEEGEGVVEAVLGGRNDLKLVEARGELERLRADGVLVLDDVGSICRGPYLRTVPGWQGCDGFFAAVVEAV